MVNEAFTPVKVGMALTATSLMRRDLFAGFRSVRADHGSGRTAV